MKVVVREAAALDLDAIFAWISKDNPPRRGRDGGAHPAPHQPAGVCRAFPYRAAWAGGRNARTGRAAVYRRVHGGRAGGRDYGARGDARREGSQQGETLMRNRAGNFSVGRLMEFLTALGQDLKITVKPTRKEQGKMEVVVGER
jgi:hypothetical protein